MKKLAWLIWLGWLVPALAVAEQAGEKERALEAQVAREPGNGAAWIQLGVARQAAKKLDGAAAAYQKAIDLKFGVPVATYNLATVYALKGDRDRALAALEQATKAGFARIADLEADPDLASLRADPRWRETVKRLDAAAHPCKGNPKNRELDFWLGEWEVRAPQGRLLGTSSIQNLIEGCVIYENWSGSLGHTGKSFNFYDAANDRWQQTWVDDTGGVLELHGHLEGGVMRYLGEQKQADGSVARQRLSFTPLPEGRVRQLWEQSTDGGKSWSVTFEGIYGKKK